MLSYSNTVQIRLQINIFIYRAVLYSKMYIDAPLPPPPPPPPACGWTLKSGNDDTAANLNRGEVEGGGRGVNIFFLQPIEAYIGTQLDTENPRVLFRSVYGIGYSCDSYSSDYGIGYSCDSYSSDYGIGYSCDSYSSDFWTFENVILLSMDIHYTVLRWKGHWLYPW